MSSRMKLPYYPGCTLKTKADNFERSAIASARKLGVELVELPRWNCCGTVYSLTDDDLIHHVAPVRNLVRVQEMNDAGLVENEYRMVTLCSMCFNTLKRTNQRMRENPEDLEKVNSLMDREDDYLGKVEVVHFLEILREIGFDAVREMVEKPLEGLKVAPYYGCMLVRPKEIGIDDPEEPSIQEELIEALGAEPVDTPYKKVCCGSYQTVRDPGVVAGLAHDILTHSRRAGADVLVTSCPLCAFNLDSRQREVRERHPSFEEMPVLYFTQLMALGLGLGPEYYGFERNYISPEPLLERKGLVQEEDNG